MPVHEPSPSQHFLLQHAKDVRKEQAPGVRALTIDGCEQVFDEVRRVRAELVENGRVAFVRGDPDPVQRKRAVS